MPPNTPKMSDDVLVAKLQSLAQASQDKLAALDSAAATATEWKAPIVQPGVLGTAKDVAIKLAQGGVDLGQSVVGVGSLLTGGAVGEGMRAIGYDPERTNQILGEGLSDAQKAADAKVQNADGFVDTIKASLQNPRSVLGSVAESAPGMLAGMGATGAIARKIAAEAALSTFEGRALAQAMSAAGKTEAEIAAAAMATKSGAAAAQAAVEAAGGKLMTAGAIVEGAQSAGQIADQAQAAGREYSDYALPAIAAGAGTAAIGMVSNKIFGDAATDLATGSKTLTGTKLARLGKEAFSEGVTEEMPQSAQEQFFTNIAMGEADTSKGVANAAGSGLVAGAAMGAGFGMLHKSPNAQMTEAKAAEQVASNAQAKAKFVEAAKTNDIAPFTNPKSKDYDLSKAIGVLTGHALGENVAPEVKAENLKKAGELLTKLEQEHADAAEAVHDYSPEGVAGFKAELAKNEAEIAKADPDNAEHIANLRDISDTYQEMIDAAGDTKKAEKAKIALSRLDRQLSASRAYMSSLVGSNEAVVSQDEVTNLVNDAAVPASASKLVALSMTQPEALPAATALKLAEDKTNALDDAQRAHLRVFSAARQAENALSDTNKVSQEVMYGSDQHIGIAQYHTNIANAIAAGAKSSAERQLAQLDKFASQHEDKAATAKRAVKGGLGGQIVFNETTRKWEAHPAGTFDKKTLRENGGLALNSARLVNDIGTEAKALRAAHTEMNSATSLKFGVQSVSSKQDTVPSGNINTPQMEEDTARPELRPGEGGGKTTPAPQSQVKSKLEQGRDRHAKQEAAVAAAEAAIAKRKAEKEQATAASNSSPAASPSSTPASPSLADARGATAPSSAAAAETSLEQTSAKPAADESQAASEANAAPATEAATAEAEKTTTLSVFDTEHKTDVPYQEQNLVGVYFTQTPGSDTGSQRPLAKVKDFISALRAKTAKLGDFLQQQSGFSDEQRAVVRAFMASATEWNATITANLKVGNAGYGYMDPMQFLLNEQGDVDENVKTAIAYAAFSWVAENAARPEINTKEQINAILNRSEDASVSDAELRALEHVGTRQNVVVNALGQRIVAALGLKSLASAPRNLQPDLEASIGAHAMKLLMDLGMLERATLTGAELSAVAGKEAGEFDKASHYFLKLARSEAGLNEQAEAIFQANKGTKGIIDKLFGVEPGLKAPSTTPITPSQKTTRNTSMGIPAELREQVANDDAKASFIRDDMYNLAGQMDPEIFLQIAGKEPVTSAMHKSRRKSQQAKNDGLAREFDRFMGYVGDNGTDEPLFFEHSVWMQQRVGIATNLINPQSSKIHRHMLFRSAWESKIGFNDVDAMTNFKLRVAEGLGVKTDKKSQDKALADFAGLMTKPEIKGAVAVLVKTLTGGTDGKLSENDQQVLLAGVKTGGEDMHSLSALMALAQMTVARKEGKAEFTSHMMAEVDGVTNGPMLSHLLLGAAETVKEMFTLLNRGGFFEQGSDHTEYNNWRDAPGNFDLYENTALHMTQAINAAGFDAATMASIYAFTGELANDDGVVQKAGRNIIKTPLTAMVFGSSVNNAVNSMADNFVDAIYQAIEDGKMDRKEIIAHLAGFGVNVPAGADLMEHEFSAKDIKKIKGIFKGTIGEAVAETMKADFATFIAQRTEFNKTAQLTFEVYNAVYQGMREEMVQQLIADGKIAVNPTTGLPIHDLTNAQEAELRKNISALTPVMNTPMSKEEGKLKNGLMVAKSERKLSTDPVYQNEVKFGTPFGDNGAKSTLVHGYEMNPTGPGVAMVPVSIHSADSAISVRSNMSGDAQNNHDAQGHGVNGIVDTARKMNEATWNTLLNYSPAAEVRDALLRTVTGLNKMIAAGKVSDDVLARLASSLVDYAEKHEVAAEGVLLLQAELAQGMAYRADAIKLDTMAEMNSVNQYAMEGGAFAVDAAHRSSAASLRSALEAGMSDAARSALTAVSDKLAAAIKAELAKRAGEAAAPVKADPDMDTADKSSPIAELGKSKITSEQPLVDAFNAQPLMKLADVVALLGKQKLNQFQRNLLGALANRADVNLTVQYVTKDTLPGDLLLKGETNSRGWYVLGGNTIYVMAPEFKYSGLTSELLMHELTHAALAQVIDQAQADGKGAAFELVQELEQLRNKAQAYVEATDLTEFDAAVSDVHELVSWGMTNAGFQQVLTGIEMGSANTGNALLNGMKTFVKILSGLVFGRKNDAMSTGMDVLITNVAGLLNKAGDVGAKTGMKAFNQTQPGANVTFRDLSTQDIYNALAQTNNGAQVSAAHGLHLQDLLATMVNAIYGPFGSFKAAMMQNTAKDPVDVYTEALATGVAPFASESLSAGFAFTDQEAFVLEQVEASVRTALESNDGVMTIAYKELSKLYNEVRDTLTVESFHKGDWATATQIEKNAAQALHDFIFEIKQTGSGKSDYLSRFAALGMVHEGFRAQLGFHTALVSNAAPMGFNERLNKIFNTIMSWIAGRMTDTFRGQRADHKLTSLVQQMIQIEAKKQAKAQQVANPMMASLSNTAGDLSDKARAAVEAFGKKPFFQTSSSQFIKLGGNLLSAVAGDRVDAIMEGYLRLRDATMTGQLGLAASLVNEVRGATDLNKVYHYLLRGTKHLEGIRKDTISNISKAVSGSFDKGGDYLTAEHKHALTAVVMRGDMQALLGGPNGYSVADLQKMVGSRSALEQEITAHEQQLAGIKQMGRFYLNSAKALGYFMATSRVTVDHQLFNAGNIARVYGTGMEAKVNEAQAAVAEPVIDRLASLYAIRYSSNEDLKQLSEVFGIEAARTDKGHGIEMIMKTHQALQAESKVALFADAEALQMKGYVPEIYDPYMSVVMANDEEGADLIKRGYTPMPGYLGQDQADPSGELRRIYSLRDGGMKQWNSGIISTTDNHRKGNSVTEGGQQNSVNMSAIKAGKRAGIQAMFTSTGFDPVKVTTTHMAPVLNASGGVSNYRYMMSNIVKDKLLNRDNRTEHLLGALAGNTFDKVTSKKQNVEAIKALHEQYLSDFAANPKSYLLVGPDSRDPQLRELWAMLPKETREFAKSLFGKRGMWVRNDVLDMNFGYRKLSIATVFDKEEQQRNFVEKMFVEIMTAGFGDKAQLRTRQVEDIWQAIVKETKANLVVKSWSTMSGNLRSNWSQLFLMGVSPMAILNGHRVAFKAAWEYKQDSAKLFALQHQQRINHYEPGITAAKAAYLVKRLEDSLARNPIRPLIDSGLMPTIVEDVGVDEDIYSYKSRFTEKIDNAVDSVNPHILKGLQLLTMHHSTAPYKVMSYATQISDFLARYTLYQHDIKSMSHEQAVQRASEAFINYDVPTHRKMQYANDSGLIMFSKYYVRIQKILGRIYKDSPGRVMALLAAEHMIGDQPTVLDSGFTHRFGNPFNAGALSYLGSLDSVTTVGLITSPFTTAVYNGQ